MHMVRSFGMREPPNRAVQYTDTSKRMCDKSACWVHFASNAYRYANPCTAAVKKKTCVQTKKCLDGIILFWVVSPFNINWFGALLQGAEKVCVWAKWAVPYNMPSKCIAARARAVPKGTLRGHMPNKAPYRYAAWGTKSTHWTAWWYKKELYGTANICMHLHAVRVAHPKPGTWCTYLYIYHIGTSHVSARIIVILQKPNKHLVRRGSAKICMSRCQCTVWWNTCFDKNPLSCRGGYGTSAKHVICSVSQHTALM